MYVQTYSFVPIKLNTLTSDRACFELFFQEYNLMVLIRNR